MGVLCDLRSHGHRNSVVEGTILEARKHTVPRKSDTCDMINCAREIG